MSTLKKILAAKTDQELIFYVKNVEKHTEEAVRLALAELQDRKVSLPDGFADHLETQINTPKTKKSKENIPLWKKDVVTDVDAPEYYSKTAIYVFSILFSTFFGSFMLAANCKDAGKQGWPVILFGLGFTLLTSLALDYIAPGKAYVYIVNGVGVLLMYELFWGRYIGEGVKHRAKPIWKPLIIAAVIFIPLIILMTSATK